MTNSFNQLPFEEQNRVFINAKISHNLSLLARIYSPHCTLCDDDLFEMSNLLDDFTFNIHAYVTEKLNSTTDTASTEDSCCTEKDS